MGVNHAVYAAGAWTLTWPHLGSLPGGVSTVDTSDPVLLAATAAIAAGAGVIADLDHPDAAASRHFGFLSKGLAKATAKAADGHRAGTHTFVFAAALATVFAVVPYAGEVGRWVAAVYAGFCGSVGLALVAPKLSVRTWMVFDLASAGLAGWYTWRYFGRVAPVLPWIAGGGIVVHIACDVVTKGGVPFLRPFTRRRFALGLFRVGGAGEKAASVLGVGMLAVGGWMSVSLAV